MKRADFFIVITASATLSFNLVMLRMARENYPVALVGFGEMIFTSFGLLICALGKRGKKSFEGIKEDILTAVLIGLIACGITMGILIGIAKSTATIGAVLQRTDIFFTMVLGYFLVGDRFKKTDLLFLLLLLAGAFYVIGFDFKSMRFTNPYNLFFVTSAVGISINAFLIKYRIKRIEWDILAWINSSVQAIFYLLLSVFAYRAEVISALKAHPTTFWWLVGASFWLVIYFLSYYESLARMSVWLVRAFLLTMPVFTLALEYPLFQTKLTQNHTIGVLLIIVGVLGLTLTRRKNNTFIHSSPLY
jgi:drug/metabolite transporter (DMT)-like permease